MGNKKYFHKFSYESESEYKRFNLLNGSGKLDP
jgi:hypothetical protein